MLQPKVYETQSVEHVLLLLISMLWQRQAIFESKGDKLSSSAECRIRTQRVSWTESPADWMPADKLTELSRIKLKLPNPKLWVIVHNSYSLDRSGAISIWRCRASIGIPMLKTRRSHDRLIFNMGIPIPGKDGLYIEMGLWFPPS